MVLYQESACYGGRGFAALCDSDQPSRACALSRYGVKALSRPTSLGIALPAFGAGIGFHRYSRCTSSNCSEETQCILRSEPRSRTALIGEQPNPWDLLQPQDATIRHRGAKPPRRCGNLQSLVA
jgi:hypothetical protein